MRYCSCYDGKITNKYNSFQIFFYFFLLDLEQEVTIWKNCVIKCNKSVSV